MRASTPSRLKVWQSASKASASPASVTAFGLLIAIAGCRAGIRSGRSSAAVGQAATTAVVTAIVYLIVADAGFNILFQQLGI